VPAARLTEDFRQAAQSRIVVNAHRINRGQMPELSHSQQDSEFYLVQADEPEEAAGKITEIVCRRIPGRFALIREVQVVCPMNRSRIGARSLNLDLQVALNGDQNKPVVVRVGCSLRNGDKVMQSLNDYDKEVFNGDLGFVHAVDLAAQELGIDFDVRLVNYEFGELDEIVPAYANTIHQAQGSEYPAVVIPLSTQHYPMLRGKLLYTAITRGQRLVVLVGSPRRWPSRQGFAGRAPLVKTATMAVRRSPLNFL
jgi:exodeoxyribonuclease V alpha subunit